MADVRFEFLINGERVCTTGVEGFGVLSACLTRVKRDPAKYVAEKAAAPSDWKCTPEEWASESIGICAGGLDSQSDEHLSWFDRHVCVGDEITIRVLGPGPSDPSINQET